ncbi:MAG: SPOR domain-containing protein, partial [Pseudomonadota bacterium]
APAPASAAPPPAGASAAKPAAEPATADKPAASPAPAAQPGQEVFWVCLTSFKELKEAQAYQAKLKASGLAADIWQVDLGAKGRWCRVCAGQFTERAQAAAQAQVWKKQGLDPSPFVMPKP